MTLKLDAGEAERVMIDAGFMPLVTYPGPKKPWLCLCSTCGREVQPRYQDVRKGGSCKYCAGRAVDPTEARQVMIDAGLMPLVDYPGNDKPWPCRCLTCGREVQPRYASVRKGGGCRFCAGRVRYTDDEAAAVMRAAGLEPLEPYAGANAPWRCRCVRCGHEVTPARWTVSNGSGCIYCAGRRVDPADAVAVMRSAGMEPLEPYNRAGAPWRCRCRKCRQEVAPSYNSVRSGSGCISCAGLIPVTEAEAVRELSRAGFTPLEVFPGGVGSRWQVACDTCGRTSTKTLAKIRMGRGCGHCAKNLQLTHEEAAARMREAGWEPLEPYTRSAAPWRCVHLACGQESTPQAANIRNGQGCRFCATSGFWGATGAAHLYLITHPDWYAVKVGVTRDSGMEQRMTAHHKNGWRLHRTWTRDNPQAIYDLEQAVIRRWRSEGIPEGIPRGGMPQHGYTETASLSKVDLPDLENWITSALAVAA